MRGLLILILLSFVACDSPRNHRVELSPKANTPSANVLQLASLNLKLETRWLSGPSGNVQKENSLLVLVFNEQGQLVDLPVDRGIFFFATMPSMGHPLDQSGEFRRVDQGLYVNSAIRFNMPGDWRMELFLMNDESTVLEQVSWNEFF